MNKTTRTVAVTAAIACVTALGACDNGNDPTALARVDEVVLAPDDTTIVMPEDTTLDDGGFRYRYELLDADGAPITGPRVVTWESTDPGTARVSDTGYVTPLMPGFVQIRAISGGTTGRTGLTIVAP